MTRSDERIGASSDSTTEPSRTELFGLDHGEQVLVSVEDATSIYDVLPDRAFTNLFVVSTGRSPHDIEAEVQRVGHDPNKVGVVPVTAMDGDYDGPLWTTDPVSATDLTGISIAFSRGLQHLQPDVGWFVFDDILTLLMYTDADRVHRLIDDMCQRVHQRSVVGVFVVERDLLDDETYGKLRHLCATEIRLDET